MTIDSNADVARRLRGLLAEHQVKQVDLARKLELSPMQLSRRLGGKTPFVPEELIAAARALGVSVATIFGEEPATTSTERAA